MSLHKHPPKKERSLFRSSFAGSDGRFERVKIPKLRTPALHLRQVSQRVGQACRVGHQQQRLLRQRQVAHSGEV